MNNQMVLDDKDSCKAVDCLAGNGIDRADTAGCNGKGWTEDVSFTLNTIDRPAVYDPSVHHGYHEFDDVSETVRSRYGTGGNNQPLVVAGNNSVRRLTPMECERLQGYHDGWSDVPGASDSKRYKALGNSIALPFWEFLAKRFVQIGNVKSIGSLFAGIGGFELVFQRAGAETKWDSEINPFCRKVLEYHFGNEETNKEGES